jgi:2'-5' RNA ligase
VAAPGAAGDLTTRRGAKHSAVIVRVALPAALDRLRRRCVADAADGVPGHVTLLYPFIPATDLSPEARATIADIARRHRRFQYALTGPERWPDTIYAAVHPAGPFLAIHHRLADTFLDYPIYGRVPGFELVPHVTIAEGRFADDPGVALDGAWSSLPVERIATALEVIAPDGAGRWQLVWRLPLGSSAANYNPDR